MRTALIGASAIAALLLTAGLGSAGGSESDLLKDELHFYE
jgi:hypothetical protein